jgi:hypothetical protein
MKTTEDKYIFLAILGLSFGAYMWWRKKQAAAPAAPAVASPQ